MGKGNKGLENIIERIVDKWDYAKENNFGFDHKSSKKIVADSYLDPALFWVGANTGYITAANYLIDRIGISAAGLHESLEKPAIGLSYVLAGAGIYLFNTNVVAPAMSRIRDWHKKRLKKIGETYTLLSFGRSVAMAGLVSAVVLKSGIVGAMENAFNYSTDVVDRLKQPYTQETAPPALTLEMLGYGSKEGEDQPAQVASLNPSPAGNLSSESTSLVHNTSLQQDSSGPSAPKETIEDVFDKEPGKSHNFTEIISMQKGMSCDEIYEKLGLHRVNYKLRDWLSIEESSLRYEDEIKILSDYWGIDPVWARSFLFTESVKKQFKEDGKTVRSRTGSMGLGQHQPCNISELNRLSGLEQQPETSRWSWERVKTDPIHNIDATCATIRQLFDQFHGNKGVVAASYNIGKGCVGKGLEKTYGSMKKVPFSREDLIQRIIPNLDASPRAIAEVKSYVEIVKSYENTYKSNANLLWPTESTDVILRPQTVTYKGMKKRIDGVVIAPLEGSANEVYAVADGVVESSGNGPNSFGNDKNGTWVRINHGKGFSTTYCQLGKANVRKGQKVSRGHVIGIMGQSGNNTIQALEFYTRLDVKGRKIDMNPLELYNIINYTNGVAQIDEGDSPELRKMKEDMISAYFAEHNKDHPKTYSADVAKVHGSHPDTKEVGKYQHYVVEGDFPTKLALMYNTTIDTLATLNPRYEIRKGKISPGMVLNLPRTFDYYTVQHGDHIWSIAKDLNKYPTDLLKLNGMQENQVIHPEQVIRVPL